MSKHQRYVSRELTHFVGARLATADDQYTLLIEILRTGLLKIPGQSDVVIASDGSNKTTTKFSLSLSRDKKLSSNDKYRASIVCFADIPVEDLPLHMEKYSKFGFSLSKQFLIAAGANPVFYVAAQSSTNISNPLANHPENFDLVNQLAKTNRNRGHWQNFTRAELFDEAEKVYSEMFPFGRLHTQTSSIQVPENFKILENCDFGSFLKSFYFLLCEGRRLLEPNLAGELVST